MARIKDVMSTYTDYRDEMKAFLELPVGADPAFDAVAQPLYNHAVARADTYVDREFKEKDPTTGERTGADIVWVTDPFHEGIKLAIWNFVAVAIELKNREFGVTSVRTRDISRSFAIGTRIAGGDVSYEQIWTWAKTSCRPSKLAFT